MKGKKIMTNSRLETIKKAQAVTLPSLTTTGRGNGKYSFGIVNSKRNGKRLSFSKALVAKLELEDTAYITPVKEDGVIILAGTRLFDCYSCDLRGDGKKISYCAGVVETLTEIFSLDFSQHVSMSFNNIEFDEHEGVAVAVIALTNPVSTRSTEDNAESGDVA